MTTYISSEAQKNGMDKQTKLVLEQMFVSHKKERNTMQKIQEY